MIVLAAALLAPLLAQDSPVGERITIEAKGRLSAVAERFERATGCRIRIDPGVEDREVDVAVRNATFFEAADALCRAHGNAVYFERPFLRDRAREVALPLFPGPHRDLPSCYSNDFKVAVFQFLRERICSDRGDAARVRLHIGAFIPPYLLASKRPGDVEWTLSEARDADGKDVLLPREKGSLIPRIQLSSGTMPSPRLQEGALVLRDFDLDRGLSRLKGEASIRVWASEELRVPLETGREVKAGGGRLAVSVRSVEPLGEGAWRILLDGDADKFHGRARLHGLEGWCLLAPGEDPTIEARTPPLPGKPEWIALRAWGDGRRIQVPFELKDVRFGGK